MTRRPAIGYVQATAENGQRTPFSNGSTEPNLSIHSQHGKSLRTPTSKNNEQEQRVEMGGGARTGIPNNKEGNETNY